MPPIRYELIEKREEIPCPNCHNDLREEIVWMGDTMSTNSPMLLKNIYIKCQSCDKLIMFLAHWTIYAVEFD